MRLETAKQATGGGEVQVDEVRLEFHMRRQHGLVSLVQARSAGMSRQQIQRRVGASRWRRVGPGVYQNSAVPITPHSKLLAACIAYDGLASHRSAAALHGIEGFRFGRPELVVGQNRARSAVGVIVHRSAQMDSTKPVTLHGIPCTGLSRTVLDLAGVVSRERLQRAIDAVLRDDRLRYHDLYEVLDAHARHGRNGTRRLRAVLDERVGERGVPLSDWSRWVSDLLCESGLPKPALEHRVHTVEGDFVAQVDLAYPARHLAIELDSIRWHHNRDSFVNDRRRRNRLTTAGWDVLSFTWYDYSEQPAALCDVVAGTLNGTASRCPLRPATA
ncbi:type IV toxin-antitoxin system AbiEi family antitoxin domain-containing protein [Candidatus Poriferisodalis sp.]|uniref:type IV toxin-antitoxin system AbiEi family antitoxin domain-containing protein n=1 Tax=Candidatus Poriferisodalis sp. TaxID=3101277 RepID=UPI003B51D2BB